ncbi:SdpI family protein [Paenibacillus marinisediminis]
MRKSDITFTSLFFIVISILILAVGIFVPDGHVTNAIIGAAVIIALVIFDIQAPRIAKLSPDNPKVKTMRNLNRLTLSTVALVFIFMVLEPLEGVFSARTSELIAVGLIAVFMMAFGNAAPKIPFNRNMGLRLPWTIRDEDTWRLAHKVVGYASFPIAIAMFVSAFFFPVEKVTATSILTWILIPGLYSLWFFYRKSKGLNV